MLSFFTKSILLLFLILGPFMLWSQDNFIVILSDDQSWNGSSVQMLLSESQSVSDYYETPNLEQLASEGMIFSQAYAPAPKCSPSRNSILTGKSTARTQFTNTENNIASNEMLIEPATNLEIDANNITIAEWLKSSGLNYRTAHYGKWHIKSGGTAGHGFDFGDGDTKNSNGNQGGTSQADPKRIFELTNKGIAFMQQAVTDNVPFYLQISHYAVHKNTEARPATISDFNAMPPGSNHADADYAAMTHDLDEGIGLIMDEVANLGITGNTYIIFLSDNGAADNVSSNVPLKEGKTYLYEGGIRVPMIVKGPGITANSRCDEAVVGYDLFSTIAEIVNNAALLPANLDGQSLVPLFNQAPFNRGSHIYFHSPHYGLGASTKNPRSAIVDNDYKLIVDYETGDMFLYDLSNDIGETTDISNTNVAKRDELRTALKIALKNANANMPRLDPGHPSFSGSGNDVDADGLDDEWEFRELLSYNFGPMDDPDNDTFSNMDEFMNGTDPLVSNLVLALDETTGFRVQLFNEEKVRLSWTPEHNAFVDFYEIERSTNQENWEILGRFDKSNSLYWDENPVQGTSYYRLVIHRTDKEELDHSQVEKIEFFKDDWAIIFPNPTKNKLNIRLTDLRGGDDSIVIQISNYLNQTVKIVEHKKDTIIKVPLEQLPKGFYIVTIYDGSALASVSKLLVE